MRKGILIVLAVLMIGSSNLLAKASYFKDVNSMIKDFNDFNEEINTFKMISKNSFRLSNRVINEELNEVLVEGIKRTFVYGVLRTFIHTDLKSVKVTVIPITLKGKLLEQYTVGSGTLYKEDVERIVMQLTGFALDTMVYHENNLKKLERKDDWSKIANIIIYNDEANGLNILYAHLIQSFK